MSPTYKRIYAIIKKIPKGRVATYGQIARLAGIPFHARQVGYALNALPDGMDVPWQRVINAKGEVSPRAVPYYEERQRLMLKREGVTFNKKKQISLARYQWATGNPR